MNLIAPVDKIDPKADLVHNIPNMAYYSPSKRCTEETRVPASIVRRTPASKVILEIRLTQLHVDVIHGRPGQPPMPENDD